jgi:predicted YcjX-like family ATPase
MPKKKRSEYAKKKRLKYALAFYNTYVPHFGRKILALNALSALNVSVPHFIP